MRKRIPNLVFAAGIIGMAVYPRLASGKVLAPWLRTDFAVGTAIGMFLALEAVGAMMMFRRNRGGSSSCAR